MTHKEFSSAISAFALPEELFLRACDVSTKMDSEQRDTFFAGLEPLAQDLRLAQEKLAAVIEETTQELKRIKRVEIPRIHEEEENKDHLAAEEEFSKQLSSIK